MKKLKEIVVSSLVIGIGILAVKYSHVLSDFDPHYFGSSSAKGAFLMLLFFLVIKLAWGKIGGTLAIVIGVSAIINCLLPDNKQVADKSVTENDKNSSTGLLSSLVFRAGKTYVRRQLRDRQP